MVEQWQTCWTRIAEAPDSKYECLTYGEFELRN